MFALARLCADAIFRHLEGRVAASTRLSMDAMVLVRECAVGLDDIDRAVVLHVLTIANRYLSTLLCAFDHKSDAPDDVRLAAALDRWAARGRRLPDTGDRRTLLIATMCDARDEALRVRRFFRRLRLRGDGKVDAALGAAAVRLELALYILGVETVITARRPADRVKLASTREQLELVAEEYRDLYRWGPSGGDQATVDV